MTLKKGIKLISLLLLFSLFSGSLFAVEEYVSRVYKEIDVAFINKSENDLSSILKDNVDDKYYYLMENYTKKKIRRLIIEEEYPYAMTASYIVIDINIDGDFEDDDAVDLYTTIAEAYEIKLQYEKEQAIRAQEEMAKKEAEKEKIRTSVEKDYNVNTTSEGKVVYLSTKDEKIASYRWNGNFGLLDLGITTAPDLKSTLIDEGIVLSGSYEYNFNKNLTLGIDALIDFKFMEFGLGPMTSDLEVVPKIGFGPIENNLFFRFGFKNYSVLKNDNISDTNSKKADIESIQNSLLDSITSPLVGLQLYTNKIANIDLTINADYLFAGLISGGIENHASVILGFGVENVR